MTSKGTRRFWQLFHALPEAVRSLAVKNYQIWKCDPSHPSLRFRRLGGSEDLFTIRIGDHFRALGVVEADTITWIWIGSHSEYNRIVRR